jgi:hypothetical protein
VTASVFSGNSDNIVRIVSKDIYIVRIRRRRRREERREKREGRILSPTGKTL